MRSRMDRYSKNSTEIKKRSELNRDLYDRIYEISEYTNIEGIENIEKTNEIDITRIKELIKSRELEKKDYRIVKEDSSINKKYEVPVEEEKTYDIRDVLIRAKDERGESEQEYYRLNEEDYKFLEEYSVKARKNPEYIDKDELRELIDTITNTSMLNQLGDKELSLDILKDLRSDGNTIVEDSEIINSVLNEEEKTNEYGEPTEIDKSFFTSSLNFKDEDFEELKEINTRLQKNNSLIKFLLIILILVSIGVATFVIWNYFL